jgi:hypothetical protein
MFEGIKSGGKNFYPLLNQASAEAMAVIFKTETNTVKRCGNKIIISKEDLKNVKRQQRSIKIR